MRPTEKMLEGSLSSHGYRGPNARGEYGICCPFCLRVAGSGDFKWKLQYSPSKKVYYCYKCNTSGSANLLSLSEDAPTQPRVELPKADLGPPYGFEYFNQHKNSKLAGPYLNYMVKRGFDLARLVEVEAGYCVRGRFSGRVVFPLRRLLRSIDDHQALRPWRGFSARTIYPGIEPKYLYPSGMDRKNELWGRDFGWTPKKILVEGVLDALALYPSGIAAFGKNVTDEQIVVLKQIHRLGCSIVVALDGDAWQEGQVLALRMALHGIRGVRWCKLPPKTDPGVLGLKVLDYQVGLDE